MIDRNTKISAILKEKPEAVEAIASINRHFKKLKNPFLRKMLAPRVTVAVAAQVGNATVNRMLKALEDIGFEVQYDKEEERAETKEIINKENKDKDMEMNKITDLDVRPILESGVDPFQVIMDTLKNMDDDETLRIINTFEPVPLLNILKKKGYEYRSERPGDGVVHTFIKKTADSPVKAGEEVADLSEVKLTFEDLERKYDGKMLEIDVRDLEMPMPMVTILETIEQLKPGWALYVHHKRVPQYLLPELKENPEIEILSEPQPLEFDAAGGLAPMSEAVAAH